MDLISVTGFLLLHIIVVWLYHRYKHHHLTNPFWFGLFCPQKTKATRLNRCSRASLAYSDVLGPVHVPAPDYSAKIQKLSPAQSKQSLRAIYNSHLASGMEVTSTAPPVDNVKNTGKLSTYNSTTNVQQAPGSKKKQITFVTARFFSKLLVKGPKHFLVSGLKSFYSF